MFYIQLIILLIVIKLVLTHVHTFNDQPSATHPNASDKTTVDLTWEAPGGNLMSDVTIWYVTEIIIILVQWNFHQ